MHNTGRHMQSDPSMQQPYIVSCMMLTIQDTTLEHTMAPITGSRAVKVHGLSVFQ